MKKLIALFFLFTVFASPLAAEEAAVHSHAVPAEELISAEELKDALARKEDLVLLDARNKRTYDALHIEGAVLPMSEDFYFEQDLFAQRIVAKAPDSNMALSDGMGKYPLTVRIVTYCDTNCGASAVLAANLRRLGYTDVRVMKEGMQTWEKNGFPVIRAASSQSVPAQQ